MNHRTDRVIGFEDASDHLRARDVLVAANYSEEGLRAALGRSDLLGSRELDVPPGLRRTRAATALDTLIRLLFLGVPVELDSARRALHPMPLESWARANLLVLEGERAVPLVKVQPYKDLLLAADMPARIRRGAPGDFVLGVGNSSVLLAHTVVPRQARRTLDLGTGCGLLALLASPQSERVSATDKNPRAAAFASFNARLNGITNVECLTGDLFEPVAGQRFDLVISNPPYVIAPTVRYLFRDSGMRGDAFCRGLVRAAASVLEEGGYCQLMSNWALAAGQSWEEPLTTWFEDTDCDALVWAADTQDASSYATTWIQQTEGDYLGRFPDLYDSWMGYYDREGIDAITYGLITMRRSSGRPNWVRFVRVPSGSAAPGGTHVLHRFQLQDFLASMSDGALLDERFRLAPDVRLEQHYAPKDGSFSAVSTRLHLAREPSYYTMEVDAPVTTLVMSYHGERRLREVFNEMAVAMRIELDQLVAGGLSVVRRLVENGYLLPSSVADS
jgi:Methyltransferase small domain